MDTIFWIKIISVMFGFMGTIQIIKKKVSGFYIFILSDLGLVLANVISYDYVQTVLFIMYLFLNLYGISQWNKLERERKIKWPSAMYKI